MLSFMSKRKEFKSLQSPDNFTNIFHMKFSFNLLFIVYILSKISDLVSSSWYQASLDSSEDLEAMEIKDFANLKSSLEFLKNNIGNITNLIIEGHSFILTVNCSKSNDIIEIHMKADNLSKFYFDLMNNIHPLDDNQMLVSME